MTQTTAYRLDRTGHMLGACVVCGRRFRAESVAASRGMFCDCRAGIACYVAGHAHGTPYGIATPDHPVTAIHWREIRARKSDRQCDSRCQSARGADCACECAGRNHGADHAVTL
jgi:hypothetical protein